MIQTKVRIQQEAVQGDQKESCNERSENSHDVRAGNCFALVYRCHRFQVGLGRSGTRANVTGGLLGICGGYGNYSDAAKALVSGVFSEEKAIYSIVWHGFDKPVP